MLDKCLFIYSLFMYSYIHSLISLFFSLFFLFIYLNFIANTFFLLLGLIYIYIYIKSKIFLFFPHLAIFGIFVEFGCINAGLIFTVQNHTIVFLRLSEFCPWIFSAQSTHTYSIYLLTNSKQFEFKLLQK